MSPVEAVFIAATLGRAMIHEPEEFRDGPETYLERIRERQRNPPPSPRLVVRIAPFDLTNDLRVENSVTAKAAHRFLDQLGFPR